jgi:hypothetical protein
MSTKRGPWPDVPAPLQKIDFAEKAAAIRRLGKTVVRDVAEIGRILSEVRGEIGHGNWLSWLESELGWSDQTARNYVHVFELSRKSQKFLDLDLASLYVLSAPTTAPKARTEVLHEIGAGTKLRLKDVQEIVHRTRPPKRQRAGEVRLQPVVVKRIEFEPHSGPVNAHIARAIQSSKPSIASGGPAIR